MSEYITQKFPKTRISTIDICEIGLKKHHITALAEFDVTSSRKKIIKYRKEKNKISFTAWLIKAISLAIKDNETVAAMLKGKRNLVIFNHVNISIVVEKELNGQKVPIPVIIKNANERSIESISEQINEAKSAVLTDKEIVLQRKSNRMERYYYLLPGFVRRSFWRHLIKHPLFAYKTMGNVGITSVGMIGKIDGWFIPISIHPVCFGIGSIVKKPVVINNAIEIREILRMTILIDHDVIDGAPMARFISNLTQNIQDGIGLNF